MGRMCRRGVRRCGGGRGESMGGRGLLGGCAVVSGWGRGGSVTVGGEAVVGAVAGAGVIGDMLLGWADVLPVIGGGVAMLVNIRSTVRRSVLD